ncbi:unnamed protein product (macronuclear) [Paramecium tetraurelia]|uniref:Uncharacterized protein n=1 Tax=Paramecium tetraurelia TaxID=5888 RepID=A0CU80_PARTE|nr:uncharacterized protein GSPATT00010546001 [Paramecium tetraurelia]CAK74347.1 unnamed protein product [Paramecium tetraurelia]|eukprot:XP_001441744.1 hypothetical protein (macronuclear) [Paramecium tetraurelia strain d4-2]
MIPFKKLAALFIRTFSKPVANIIKRYALNNNNNRSFGRRIVRNSFIFLGNKYHAFDTYLERASIGQTNQQFFIKPLTDEAAFMKGTDLFSDLFIYACVLGLPLYEIMRQSNESAKKEAIQDEKLHKLSKEVEELELIESKIKEKQIQIAQLDTTLIEQISQTSYQFEQQIQNIFNDLNKNQ